jgi:short-subunit dehydrogenase
MRRLNELHDAAFVSGASKGLGRAFARMLLAEGVRVWGTSRDPGRLAELASAHPGAFFPVALDLADRAGAIRAFEGASAAAGKGFDLVINNAGYGVFGGFADLESSVWRSQIEDMVGTVLELSHAAFRSMLSRRRGCLVHISSIAAELPLPYMSGYNVAKAGLSALSESLMFETRGTGIRVIDFRPGDYKTEFNEAMPTDSSSEIALRARAALEATFAGSPPSERAAMDLRRALLAKRSGIVRSGSLFQARIAPLLSRILPDSVMRWGTARYFGL